ncbi:hypothetical protein STEG23_016617 [Scotinomys teguina]
MQPDRTTNTGGRTMEVVAAAPRCQLLLIMLMAAMVTRDESFTAACSEKSDQDHRVTRNHWQRCIHAKDSKVWDPWETGKAVITHMRQSLKATTSSELNVQTHKPFGETYHIEAIAKIIQCKSFSEVVPGHHEAGQLIDYISAVLDPLFDIKEPCVSVIGRENRRSEDNLDIAFQNGDASVIPKEQTPTTAQWR